MEDVNTEAAPSATETQEPTTATPAEAQNTETQEAVPYERFKEVIDQKNSYESRISELEARNEAIIAKMQAQPQQPVSQADHDSLVEQFGPDGAQAIKETWEKNYVQPMVQQQYATAYRQQYEVGKAKFGDDWSKYDYKDPITGQVQGNKVLDLMASSPSLNLESAWNATNPIDRAAIEQEIKDKLAAEYAGKAAGTPASGTTPNPSVSGEGHATTAEEAYEQAMSELG